MRNWRQKRQQKFCCKEKQKNGAGIGSCVNYHFFGLFKLGQTVTCLYTNGNYPVKRGNNDAERRGQN